MIDTDESTELQVNVQMIIKINVFFLKLAKYVVGGFISW